jgi:UDP-N-acetyl-D-mannosaminuronate dehydrogenase
VINIIEIASKQLTSVSLNDENVKKADIVLIATDHLAIDYQWLVRTAEKIIDTRNATKGAVGREQKVVLI